MLEMEVMVVMIMMMSLPLPWSRQKNKRGRKGFSRGANTQNANGRKWLKQRQAAVPRCGWLSEPGVCTECWASFQSAAHAPAHARHTLSASAFASDSVRWFRCPAQR